VILDDGRRFVAKLLARDTIRRIALLKIDGKDLPIPEWAAPSEMSIGRFAIACGRALGGKRPSVSVGMISALERRSGNAVQSDAKMSPANYGGPLIDVDGKVLGVCVPMAGGGGELAGVEWYDSGIGFAVPRPRIEAVLPRLSNGHDVESGRIGVILDELVLQDAEDEEQPEPMRRVVIVAIADPSPAARAGLQENDIIAALNGVPLSSRGELQRKISDIEAGTDVVLSIERGGKKIDVKVTLAPPRDIGPPRQAASRPATTQSSTQPSS